jgi:ssDNA-binding Zn-finger/Zn-ribbon topoisomerase 1
MRTKTTSTVDGVEECPVCRGKLRRLRNRTLRGGTVLVGLRCPECGYNSGRELEVPTKYVFHRR